MKTPRKLGVAALVSFAVAVFGFYANLKGVFGTETAPSASAIHQATGNNVGITAGRDITVGGQGNAFGNGNVLVQPGGVYNALPSSDQRANQVIEKLLGWWRSDYRYTTSAEWIDLQARCNICATASTTTMVK